VRLNLYWRGRDVIDVEVHVFRRRRGSEDNEPTLQSEDKEPTLQAAGQLAASELAEPMEPDTYVRIPFGFHA
jgi:hypothetical protein